MLVWLIWPLLMIAIPLLATLDAGASWDALQGRGISGTFTATDKECDLRKCLWSGPFVSDDGTKSLDNVGIQDSGGLRNIGDTKSVVLEPGDDGEVFAHGSKSFYWMLAILVGDLVAAVVWLRLLFRTLRARRTA